jgi:hypothetical protein
MTLLLFLQGEANSLELFFFFRGMICGFGFGFG